MKSACKETAGKGVKCRRLRRRSLHVYNVLGAECKLLILDVAVDLMSDAVRLEQHKRIKRRTPVKHRKYETHLNRCTDKLCQGGYPSSLDFLFAVCYCTDNLTQALDNADIEDTEDYDVDEYLQGSGPSLSDNAPQTNSITDNLYATFVGV